MIQILRNKVDVDLVKVEGLPLYRVPQNVELLLERTGIAQKVLLVTGPSGAGKDTIVNRLPKSAFARWRTWTTRAEIRPDEADDDPYVRVTHEQFLDEVKSGGFVEHVEYAGNLYGTHREEGAQVLARGKIPVLRVDPVGAETFLSLWKAQVGLFSNANLVSFFVVPPSQAELAARLKARNPENSAVVAKRLAMLARDLGFVTSAHYVLVNETGQVGRATEALLSAFNGFQ